MAIHRHPRRKGLKHPHKGHKGPHKHVAKHVKKK